MAQSGMGEMRGSRSKVALTFPIASQWAPVLSRKRARTNHNYLNILSPSMARIAMPAAAVSSMRHLPYQ
jgi:hypothetical protein